MTAQNVQRTRGLQEQRKYNPDHQVPSDLSPPPSFPAVNQLPLFLYQPAAAMAPRDVPDSSNIISGKRAHKTPRAPDEVVSFAQHARSTTPQPGSLTSAPPESVEQAVRRTPSPEISPQAAAVWPHLASPQHATHHSVIADVGQESSLVGSYFPPHTSFLLALPQPSTPRPVIVNAGQEGPLIRFNYSTDMEAMPALESPTSSQGGSAPAPVVISERETIIANEEGTVNIGSILALKNLPMFAVSLIGEHNMPSGTIIAHLRALLGAENSSDAAEYPTSESDIDEGEEFGPGRPGA